MVMSTSVNHEESKLRSWHVARSKKIWPLVALALCKKCNNSSFSLQRCVSICDQMLCTLHRIVLPREVPSEIQGTGTTEKEATESSWRRDWRVVKSKANLGKKGKETVVCQVRDKRRPLTIGQIWPAWWASSHETCLFCRGTEMFVTKLILPRKDELFGDKQLSQFGRIEALYLQTDRSSRPVMAWSAYMVTDDEILDCEFGTDRTRD